MIVKLKIDLNLAITKILKINCPLVKLAKIIIHCTFLKNLNAVKTKIH